MEGLFLLVIVLMLIISIVNVVNIVSANSASKKAIIKLEEENETLLPIKDKMDQLQVRMGRYLSDDSTDKGMYAQEINSLLSEYQQVRRAAIKQKESCKQAYYELTDAMHKHVRKQNMYGGGANDLSALSYYSKEDRAHQAIQNMPTLSEDNMLLQKAMLYVERHRNKISGEMIDVDNIGKLSDIKEKDEYIIESNPRKRKKKKWPIILLITVVTISVISIFMKIKYEEQPYISGSVSLNGLTLSIEQHQTRLIRIKYENEGSDWSLGWGDPSKVTMVTDKGTYYAHLFGSGPLSEIRAGKKGSRYVWMGKYDGTIESLTIETVCLLSSSGLPMSESKTSITINNTYGKEAEELLSGIKQTSGNKEDELQNSEDNIAAQPEVIEYIVNTSGTDLNIRKSPDKNGELVAKIKNGTSFMGTGNKTEEGWLEIYIPDTEQTGWVNEQYVRVADGKTEEGSSDAEIQVDPSIQAAIDSFVENELNKKEIFVNSQDKPDGALMCMTGMCQTYSSNTDVATVDENGVVTGISPGEAYIVFEAMGISKCYRYIIH